MSRPTEIYASRDGVWGVYRYYTGDYLLEATMSDGRVLSVYLQGDDALQFEKEFCDEGGYPIEGKVAGTSRARLVLQEYLHVMTEDTEETL